MATYSLNSFDIGKGVTDNGTSVVFYGKDIGEVTDPSGIQTIYEPTTTFDLTGFQPFKIVCTTLAEIKKTGPASATTQSAQIVIGGVDSNDNITWLYGYPISFSRPALGSGSTYTYSTWINWLVAYDITNDYSKYAFYIGSTSGDSWGFVCPSQITISNLTADITPHTPGYMWVDGLNLCYTDSYGYKHKIAYDSNYVNNVGVNNKGYIWLDDSDSLRIYYVDENGAVRRTYPSVEWYGGGVNVGTSNKGYMWINNDGDNRNWLAFIGPNGDKRRLMNGPPAGYV